MKHRWLDSFSFLLVVSNAEKHVRFPPSSVCVTSLLSNLPFMQINNLDWNIDFVENSIASTDGFCLFFLFFYRSKDFFGLQINMSCQKVGCKYIRGLIKTLLTQFQHIMLHSAS